MMTAQKKASVSLYESVVQVTADYLGPAAGRFIDRQIENHLNKPPSSLQKKDLEILIDWARVAIALLTEDRTIVDEYGQRLSKLGTKGTS